MEAWAAALMRGLVAGFASPLIRTNYWDEIRPRSAQEPNTWTGWCRRPVALAVILGAIQKRTFQRSQSCRTAPP